MYDIDYAEKPTFGYVICPLYIGANKLYVKVILPRSQENVMST